MQLCGDYEKEAHERAAKAKGVSLRSVETIKQDGRKNVAGESSSSFRTPNKKRQLCRKPIRDFVDYIGTGIRKRL
jgi:hypothetical protein